MEITSKPYLLLYLKGKKKENVFGKLKDVVYSDSNGDLKEQILSIKMTKSITKMERLTGRISTKLSFILDKVMILK